MIKKIYPILTTLLALFLSANVNSQSNYRETVWLQINRDIYLAGEDIIFNASLLENDTYKPSVLSKNIRLELIDENGNKIIKKNLELSNSRISGKISIPTNIETGLYHVVSYTNWMRNFSKNEFSSFPLRILNNNDANQDSLLLVNKQLNIAIRPYADQDDQSLMKCSVYTTNTYNDPISSRGVILSGPGDTVMTFHTDNTGWGTSLYRPADPGSYQVFAIGFSKNNIDLKLINKESSNPETTVSEKYGYLNIDLKGTVSGQKYKVLVHRLYSWSWYQSVEAQSDNIIFRIPVRDLPSGISQCVVLNEQNDIIFKRLWSDYKEESSDIGIEMEAASVVSDEINNINYYTRGSFNEAEDNCLYLLTDAYIPGTRIENYLPGLPGWPANYKIPASQEAFDAWIINNNYPDKASKDFFKYNPDYPDVPEAYEYINNIEFYPETRGGIFAGEIINKNDRSPVSQKYVALSVLNDNSFYSARTDNKGRFVFTFPDQTGPRDYMLNFIEEYDPSWQINVKDDYADFTNENTKKGASFTAEELIFLKNRLLNLKLGNIYFNRSSAENGNISLTDSLPMRDLFYGIPDISIMVEDYIRLPNLREVIFEVVPFVNVRQVKKKYVLKVSGDNVFASEYPTLILFDGIPIYDYEELLNLPPDRIKIIRAVNNFYIHGNAIFEGIIDIRSVNKDFGGLSIPPNTILSTFMLPQKGEYLPLISKKPDRPGIPNIDNILIWKTVNAGSSGKESIYFNNNPGMYNIFVYGFDSKGKWHSGRIIIEN